MAELTLDVPVDHILDRPRSRPVDPARVDALAVSIEESGQINPILVRPVLNDAGEPRYERVLGGHRLAAHRNLGRARIRATVRHLTDAEADLLEIDENLIRNELNPLERAQAIAQRLDVWAKRFPDKVEQTQGGAAPKRGRPGKSLKVGQFLDGRSVTMGFAEETAAEVGLSRATVFNALAVHRGIDLGLQALLARSWVAKNGSVLRQIAALDSSIEQSAVATLLISGRTKNVSDARAIVAGATPASERPADPDAPLNALRKAWKGASKSQRDAMLNWLAGQSLPNSWEVRRG